SGTPRSQLYEALTAQGLTHAEPPNPRQEPTEAPPPQVAALHEKDFADAPATGARDPKVTIVEWADFQCPFCGRAAATMDQLLTTYPNDVRLVFKHQPLPFHPNA